MILKMLGIVVIALFILWIWRRIAGDNVTPIQLFNRYTFNIIPNTFNGIGRVIGSGVALIYCGALLVGFFSGFYALYKGTDLLVGQIIWQVSSIKTTGEVLDADNSRNMSQALVRFNDQNGQQYEFTYTANYNGTQFSIGEKLPVYYQSESVLKSATLNNKGAYAGVVFLYFYGLAVSMFAIFVGRSLYRSIKKDRGIARLEKEGMLISVKVSAIIPSGNYLRARAEYRPMLSKAVYYYESGPIALDSVDLERLKGATAKVKVLPTDPSIYLFYTEDLKKQIQMKEDR